MLEVNDLHAFYGKSHVLHGLHLTVREGEVVSLIGRSGVGRSTTVKAVMGQVTARGSVRFEGRRSWASRRTRSPGAGSATCRRTAPSSRISPCARTSCSG